MFSYTIEYDVDLILTLRFLDVEHSYTFEKFRGMGRIELEEILLGYLSNLNLPDCLIDSHLQAVLDGVRYYMEVYFAVIIN